MLYRFFCRFLLFGLVFSSLAYGAEPIPVKAFAQLPTASSMRLSPDGNYIAMTAPYKGKAHLIIQAKDDFRIPYKQSVNMVAQLEKNKKNVRFVTLQDGDHTLDTTVARTQTLLALETFLAQNIGK